MFKKWVGFFSTYAQENNIGNIFINVEIIISNTHSINSSHYNHLAWIWLE